jgi:hypothetical protein
MNDGEKRDQDASVKPAAPAAALAAGADMSGRLSVIPNRSAGAVARIQLLQGEMPFDKGRSSRYSKHLNSGTLAP